MSVLLKKEKAVRRASWHLALLIPTLAGFAALMLFGSERVASYFTEGLYTAAERVLPTTFPFMVLSSFICSLMEPALMPHLARAFSAIYGVDEAGLGAVLIGNLAGFPIGGRMSAELYKRGAISKADAEKLSAYSSNPSPSFVVAGVGGGLFRDVRIGVILLLSVYIGSILSAQFLEENGGKCRFRVKLRGRNTALSHL